MLASPDPFHARAAVLAAAAFAAPACVYGTPDPYFPDGAVPAFSQVDRAASEVRLVDEDDEDLGYESPFPIRDQIADVLERSAPGGSGLARFRAKVTVVDDGVNPGVFIPPVALFIPAGYFTETATVSVAISIETATSTMEGAATAEQKGGAYGSAFDRALHSALHDAVSSARITPKDSPSGEATR